MMPLELPAPPLPNLENIRWLWQPKTTFTCLEKDSRNDGPAEWAGSACGVVFGQSPKAGLAEDVTARVAHVGVEVHIQAHGADVAVLFRCVLILVIRTHLITQGLQNTRETFFLVYCKIGFPERRWLHILFKIKLKYLWDVYSIGFRNIFQVIDMWSVKVRRDKKKNHMKISEASTIL